MTDIDLKDWQAENLRLSVFMVDPIDPLQTRSWERLVGSVPDELRTQPPQQLVTEEGPFLNGRLRVEARGNRFDWRLFPDHKQLNSSFEFPSLGSYAASEEGFRNLMLKWLDGCPAIHRIAYGAILLLPANSVLDAYKILAALLPAVEIDIKNTRDFTYRINRRRESRCGIDGLKINRLSTWSAVQIIEAVVDVSAGGHPSTKVTQLPNSRNICRLELDINTAPEYTAEFTKDFVAGIFDELVDMGNEIAIRGDTQ